MLQLPEELLEKIADLFEGDEVTLNALAGAGRSLYRIARMRNIYAPEEGVEGEVERLIERMSEWDLVR